METHSITEQQEAAYIELVKNLAKSGSAIAKDLTPDKAHMLHMALGLGGELAELAENAVSYEYGMLSLYDSNLNLKEECGDLLFYTQGLLQMLDMSIKDLLDDLALDGHESERAKDALLWVFTYGGRAIDVVKKYTIYNTSLKVGALAMNLQGMLLWLLILMRRIDPSLNMQIVVQGNIDKLNVRYQGKYNDLAAQARADKA